jgi:hypothetical protein
MYVPVAGGGVPLFGNPPGRPVALERVHLGTRGVLTDMRFRVLSADRQFDRPPSRGYPTTDAGMFSLALRTLRACS